MNYKWKEFTCILFSVLTFEFLRTKSLIYSFFFLSTHSVKSVQKQSFFWSVFSRIQTEYSDILRISPYSVRMWENTDQEKLRIWTLLTQWRDAQVSLAHLWPMFPFYSSWKRLKSFSFLGFFSEAIKWERWPEMG